MGTGLRSRAGTRLIWACLPVSFAILAFWFVGQMASANPTREVPDIVLALFPGTWPPAARGILWLFVGATAVGFNLIVMYPQAQSRAGRIAVAVAGTITGASFLVFAIGSFLAAPWSIIH